MSLQNAAKNGLLTSGCARFLADNQPTQYKGRQKQYFDKNTLEFIERNAKYTSDYIEADVQGLDETNPEAWRTVHMRFAESILSSATGLREFDDYKAVLIAEKDVIYLPPGAKVKALGSTWLCINPENLSGSDGSGIIQRCNAVWTTRDYWGNLHDEPICVDKRLASASQDDYQAISNIEKGYYNVKCSYNARTAQIDNNTRMILGKKAYRVTGYGDFTREFTDDADSVRLLQFTIRIDEPNDALDDLENHVAGGANFSWEVRVSGSAALSVGQTAAFTATSYRCGGEAENALYRWESDDDSIATVDNAGNVTAIAEGETKITAYLAQNDTFFGTYDVTVTSGSGIGFVTAPPETISAYENATLTVEIIGEGDGDVADWSFDGADTQAYTVEQNGNTVTISCWQGSVEPLTVTATYGTMSVSAVINLEGM